jgi:hypothetical protein
VITCCVFGIHCWEYIKSQRGIADKRSCLKCGVYQERAPHYAFGQDRWVRMKKPAPPSDWQGPERPIEMLKWQPTITSADVTGIEL